PAQGAVRTIEIKERRPSELARVVPALPDHGLPGHGVAVSVPLGGDPYQTVLPGATWPLLARTRCHARSTLDPDDLVDDELPALVRLCATLIARFQARGLELCGVDLPARAGAIAADAGRRGKELSSLPWDLAQESKAAFAIWKARKA
ncbi:MAG: hypothetical protein H0X45_05340, partial [Planctomycetes bacterium]|nr:hypothetical protein [Planctomycetota bacterium]